MDRKEFLLICQEVSTIPMGKCMMRQNVPERLQVVSNGVRYYPFGYIMTFDQQGHPIHAALLHDLKACATIQERLENVERYKKED